MQMKMFLTRLGFNSRMVVTGDLTQIDLPLEEKSGLFDEIFVQPASGDSGVAYGSCLVSTKNNLEDYIGAFAVTSGVNIEKYSENEKDDKRIEI